MKRISCLLLALALILALSVTAFAVDETGSITIKGTKDVPVAGKTFNAYKILDVKSYTGAVDNGDGATTPATVVYTVPAELKKFYADRYELTGDEGDFDAKVVAGIAAESDLFAFAADALDAAKKAGITPSGTGAVEESNYVITGLPLGYYVVEDTAATKPVSALILDTTNPSVEIDIKADKPSIDKKIDGTQDTDNSTTGDVEYNNAAIGDKVPYKVTSKVPDMTGYTKYYFVVNDTLSKGLTFNDDVAITVGNKKLVKDTDFTVVSNKNADGTTSVEIVFKNFIQYKELKAADGTTILAETGSPITITYSATVNENAVIGTAGNPNEVKLTYSNNPNVDDGGTPGNPDKPTSTSPTGETPKEVTRTYVTDLEIIKVDQDGKRLTGAEFKLVGEKINKVIVTTTNFVENENGEYWKLKDGTFTKTAPTIAGDETDNSDLYASISKKYILEEKTEVQTKTESVDITATVGSDGVLRFEGLSAGEYTITEIKAPDGYNLLKAPITVTIGWTAPASGKTECTWTYTWGNTADTSGNSNTVTVTNNAGLELPSTGGIGTTIFYILGSVLLVGAAILLITKKRMSAEK